MTKEAGNKWDKTSKEKISTNVELNKKRTRAKSTIKNIEGLVTINQNETTNHLTLLMSNSTNTAWKMSENGDIIQYNGFSVKVNNAKKITLSTKQALGAFTTAFHYKQNYNNSLMKISVNDFMKIRGKTNRQDAIKQLKKDVNILLSLHVQKDGRSGGTNIFQVCEYDPNTDYILVHFTEVYGASLKASSLMHINHSLLQLEGKDENLYQIGFHLTVLDFMSRGIISVSKLLEKTKFPTYEFVKKNMNRKYKDKIILPFEKCLDMLVELKILQSWQYELKGEKLTDNEILNISKMFFIDGLYIAYKVNKQPIQTSLFFD